MPDLPLTIPLDEIVRTALAELELHVALDRDEAYLLTRLNLGESLASILEAQDG